MWGAYFCVGSYKRNVVAEIIMVPIFMVCLSRFYSSAYRSYSLERELCSKCINLGIETDLMESCLQPILACFLAPRGGRKGAPGVYCMRCTLISLENRITNGHIHIPLH